MPLQWWSRTRVLLTLYCSIGLGTISWVGSYLIWLGQGCMPFLPFVSDFAGGLSGPLFMWGMFFAALLITPSWFDYYYTIHADLAGKNRCWRCLHTCVPVVGIFCSASIMGVALNPWNLRLEWHLLSANGIFCGGAFFLFLDALLGYGRGRSFKGMLCVAVFALTSLILMCFFMTLGHKSLKAEGIDIDFTMLGSDFKGYCIGSKGSIHSSTDVNLGAMFEWFLLASIVATAFIKLTAELSRSSVVAIASTNVESRQLSLQGDASNSDVKA